MSTWTQTDLPGSPVHGFVYTSLQPVKNGAGLLRLICVDYNFNVWCAIQRVTKLPALGLSIGPPATEVTWGTLLWRGTSSTLSSPTRVNVWQNLGAQNPQAASNSLSPPNPTVCAATNGAGAIEIFTVGGDGFPYHCTSVNNPPVQANFGFETWTAWQPLTNWPANSIVPTQFFYPYISPMALTLLGDTLVFCCISSSGTLYYDYQVVDAANPAGYSWASVANGGLFSIPAPALTGQSVFNVTLQNSGQGLNLIVQTNLGGIGGVGYYVSTTTNPSKGWSGFQPIPASGFMGLPNIYPAYSPELAAATSYLPGAAGSQLGSLLAFGDASGELLFLRQIYSSNGESYSQLEWNNYYEQQLPPGSTANSFVALTLCENVEADQANTTALHMDLFYVSPDGLTINNLEYVLPTTIPSPYTLNSGVWPSPYSSSTTTPTIIASASTGGFGAVNGLAVILDKNNKQQLFGISDGGSTLHVWSQP
jgi:hypothetical protein